MKVKVWKEGSSGEPKFPTSFKILKKAVLQKTDIGNNNNKYYAIELHDGKGKFRVYTHYGRTDDLTTNPEAGHRESRYCDSIDVAEFLYDSIFRQKTGKRKGYQQVNLASSKIGSRAAQGQSCGDIDDKTLKKIKDKNGKTVVVKSSIPKPVADLVEYLYSEAVKKLTKTVDASITANGIETPLGVLTLGQIDKGQSILDDIAVAISKKKKAELIKLSGQFYTAIPYRLGRTRQDIEDATITTAKDLDAKNDTLQLMRDMLNVNGKSNVLISSETEKKYKALNCEISSPDSAEFARIKKLVGRSITVENIWRVSRPTEQTAFDRKVGNEKLLFHGSDVSNWVGILSRGILLPKVVVKLGVHRTDSGWLGHGIYFGDDINTSYSYAGSGRRDTSFIAVVRVALGKVKKFYDITHGLTAPPKGYDSCHGVSSSNSDFSDDEFVIYRQEQQKLEYLVECS